MNDKELLGEAIKIARAAGERLLTAYTSEARPKGRADIYAAALENDRLADESAIRTALLDLRAGVGWVTDELETKPLPEGEWWTVDAVEGNVNHVHGMPEWGVSITLVRDRVPVLTVVHQPVGDLTWTALRGGGAWLNGSRLRASEKTDLEWAITVTGQAEMGQTDTYRRIGDSITAMLPHALMVKATVPSTFPMLRVAEGRNDVFWQLEPTLPGIAAGILLVTEAGGLASRLDGSPWEPGAPDILVAALGVASAAVAVLGAL